MRDDKDPLAEWRASGEPPPPPAVTAGKETYKAFDDPVDRRPTRLHLCPGGDKASEWLPYYDLHRVVHDAHGTRIGLVWAYAVVIIQGRHLKMLDRHLAQEAVAELRAFDPVRHHAPADDTAPVIESIEIITESRKTMMEAEMALIAAIGRH